jgi:hypothetical protein
MDKSDTSLAGNPLRHGLTTAHFDNLPPPPTGERLTPAGGPVVVRDRDQGK